MQLQACRQMLMNILCSSLEPHLYKSSLEQPAKHVTVNREKKTLLVWHRAQCPVYSCLFVSSEASGRSEMLASFCCPDPPVFVEPLRGSEWQIVNL